MQMAVSFLEHPLYKKFLELKCDRRVVTHFWPPGGGDLLEGALGGENAAVCSRGGKSDCRIGLDWIAFNNN